MNLSGTHEAPGAEEELGEDWEKISRRLPQLVQNLPKEKLLRFSASSDLSSILAGLYRDGAVILENIQSPEACDRVKEDMRPYVDRAAYGDGFLGKQTKRASAVVARSRTSWGFVQHPLLLQICKGVLSRQILHVKTKEELVEKWLTPGNRRLPFQLSLSQVICIGGGNRWQPRHRDGWAYILDMQRNVELEVSTVWALDDFTSENGATRVFPGSHRLKGHEKPNASDAVQAVMKKGSVVVYLGNTWHSGGENRTNQTRWGLNIDYNLACLRQEENQFLSCPPSIARHFPVDLQTLIGYTMPAASFGYFGEYQNPKDALREDLPPLDWASSKI